MDEMPKSIRIILSKKTNYVTRYGTAVVVFIACLCIILSFFIHLPEQRLVATYNAAQFGDSKNEQQIKYDGVDEIMTGRELYIIQNNDRAKIGFVSKVDVVSKLLTIHIDSTIILKYINDPNNILIYCDIYNYSLGENLYKQFAKILVKQ
ncbi:hypothetical protein FACS1894169_14740 [Bacteroidia bacterium]|nr:hypothetical protein FACS1894169_14740 [Bacteroidia bacterium]